MHNLILNYTEGFLLVSKEVLEVSLDTTETLLHQPHTDVTGATHSTHNYKLLIISFWSTVSQERKRMLAFNSPWFYSYSLSINILTVEWIASWIASYSRCADTCPKCYLMCTAIVWWWKVCLAVVRMEVSNPVMYTHTVLPWLSDTLGTKTCSDNQKSG